MPNTEQSIKSLETKTTNLGWLLQNISRDLSNEQEAAKESAAADLQKSKFDPDGLIILWVWYVAKVAAVTYAATWFVPKYVEPLYTLLPVFWPITFVVICVVIAAIQLEEWT